jgi:hypothetical protein
VGVAAVLFFVVVECTSHPPYEQLLVAEGSGAVGVVVLSSFSSLLTCSPRRIARARACRSRPLLVAPRFHPASSSSRRRFGVLLWSRSWRPGRPCVSPPHRRSTHQPPHEQLLVRMGRVVSRLCRSWLVLIPFVPLSFPCRRPASVIVAVPPAIHPTSSCS